MAHGVKLEIAEGDALHLAIGGVILDPVLVAAEAVARVQHRRVPVGSPRQLIQPSAGERSQPFKMRLQSRKVRSGEIERQQVAQSTIDGIKILSRAVRRDVCGATARDGDVNP